MRRQDWTLLTLGIADGQFLTPVQMQKSLFLFQKKFPFVAGDNYYNFQPYNYGPFDASIYHDAETLSEEGFALVSKPPGQRWFVYSATPQGIREANKIKGQVPIQAAQELESIVNRVKSLSFSELVNEVYKEYPEYKVNSVFQG
jgi:uncharacterized protein YwgA